MKEETNTSPFNKTLGLAILIFAFLQALTIWIESIYRLSLIKLSMGAELLGIFLFLLPVLHYAVRRRDENHVYRFAFCMSLMGGLLFSLLNAGPWLIVFSGVAVGSFLISLCYLLSRSVSLARPFVLAFLLFVAIRTWRSSLDLVGDTLGAFCALALVVTGLSVIPPKLQSSGSAAEIEGSGKTIGAPLHLRIAAMVLLFSSLTFVYLFLSSPAVVSAWSGSNSWAGATILAVAWAVGVGLLERGAAPGPRALMGWNISFVASLLIGLWLCRVEFPLTPGQVTVVNGMGSRMNSLPFYIAYLLSPVLLFNVQWVESVCAARRSRDFALPVILGMGLLVLVTILLIFTNAWGYVGPLGPPLRNRFYLPFAVAGLGTVLPLLVSFPLKHFSFSTGPGLSRPASIALVLAALAMVGAWVNTARPAIPAADRKELTILTYNMQQGSADGDTEGPGAGKRNYTAQLEFIRSVNADIIGLQESDTARPSGGNVNAPLYFAQKLGYHLYYGPSTVAGTFGTAILSRYPLENPRTFYTYSTVDEVGTAVAEIEVGGRRIAIFNNHPAGPPEVMHAHVDALVQEIGQYEHVISVGDYNFEQSEPYYAKLATVLKDSWLSLNPNGVGGLSSLSIEGGFSSFPLDMRDRIDHIFVSRSFGVAEAYYVPPPESETDHPAHWAKVQW